VEPRKEEEEEEEEVGGSGGGSWRRLHNDELHNLYNSPIIIKVIKSRRMRWAGYVASMGEIRNANNVLVGKPKGKRPLKRPRSRWEDNIRMNSVGRCELDPCSSGQGPVAEHGNESFGSIKSGEFLD
jgi:hypothetical protein